jgi:hypothetical protein
VEVSYHNKFREVIIQYLQNESQYKHLLSDYPVKNNKERIDRFCNRSRVQGSWFKGCVHRKPACGSEADIPPSGQK